MASPSGRIPLPFIASCALLAALVAGCRQPLPASAPDEIVVGIEAAPLTLDPRRAADAYSAKLCQLLYSGLFRRDERLELVPDLLESFQVVPPTTYRFVLRPGLTFHDGRPLTMRDVAATLEAVRDPATASPLRPPFEKIRELRVVDDRHLEIELAEPFAPFLGSLTLGILPEGKMVGVGSGPFRLQEEVADQRVVLARFEGYVHGASRIPRVVFRIVRDDSVRVLELLNGRIDLLQNAVPPPLVGRLQRDPGLSSEIADGINTTYLGFNLRQPPLNQLLVRRAIAHALDRGALIRYKLYGLAEPAFSLLSPLHWAYAKPFRDYEYDPAAARRLLDQAGFPDPDGPGPRPRFKLTYKTSTKRDRIGIARLIARYLKEVGIEVQVLPFEWGTLFRDINAGNFQLYSLTWVGVNDPDIFHYIFHSSQQPPQGGNRGGYGNEELDRLTEEGRRTLDRTRAKAIYGRVQELVAEELPVLPLWYEKNVALFRHDVQGYALRPDASFYGLVNAAKGAPPP